MTGEQFRTEYHLLDRVSDGAVETWHAQAATGAMIMVHFLRGSPQENATLLAQLERLETGRASRVLRTVDVDDVTAIVTRFILDFVTLEEWVRDGLMPESTLPVAAPAMPQDTAQPDPVPNHPIAPADPVEAGAVQAALPPIADDAASAPGEFTMLFKAVKPPADKVEPVVPAQPAAAPPAPSDEGPRLGSMPPLGTPPRAEPPPPQPLTPPQPPTPAAAPEPAPAADAPGEFTLMFRAASAAPAPEPPSPPPLKPLSASAPAPSPAPAQAPDRSAPPRPMPPVAPAARTADPPPPTVEPTKVAEEPAAMPDWLASLQTDQAADEAAPADPESDRPTEPPAPWPEQAAAAPPPSQNATPPLLQNAMPASPPPAAVPTFPGVPRPPAAPPVVQAPVQPPVAPMPPAVQPPIAPMPPAAQAPSAGEFTRMFGAAARPADMSPVPPRAPSPVPPQPAAPPAAPFGGPMSFGTPAPSTPFRPHAEPAPEPGEYTRLFGSPVLPPPPPMPQAPGPGAGAGTGALDAAGMGGSYFERLTGGAPHGAGSAPRPPSPPPAMPSPPGFTGPSEFTRVIAAVPLPGAQTGSAAPALQQTPAPAPKRMSNRTLALALIGVLVAAVIFVVVVALVG